VMVCARRKGCRLGLRRAQTNKKFGRKSTMNEAFLVCVYSEDSHRHAILADDGVTGILYLHAPSDDASKTGEVEATCFVYNRVEPIDSKDVQSYRPNRPPVAKGHASENAVCQRPEWHTWELRFSTDGRAALLVRDCKPWAIVSLDAPRGISKAIEAPGPWGSPWSNEAHQAGEWSGRARRCT
jgi:hypothetical protein